MTNHNKKNLLLKFCQKYDKMNSLFALQMRQPFICMENINKHNVRIWGLENPQITREIELDSLKDNVCGQDFMQQSYWSTFVSGKDNIYLDVLKEYVVPQLEVVHSNIIFQEDEALPHWGINVHGSLNERFPDHMTWSPHSPDITLMEFFLWAI